MKKLFEEIKNEEKIIIKNKKGEIQIINRELYSQLPESQFDNSINYKNYYIFNDNDNIKKYYCPMSGAIYINDNEIENEEEIYNLFIQFLLNNKPYNYIIQRYIDKYDPNESHISIIFKNDFFC